MEDGVQSNYDDLIRYQSRFGDEDEALKKALELSALEVRNEEIKGDADDYVQRMYGIEQRYAC